MSAIHAFQSYIYTFIFDTNWPKQFLPGHTYSDYSFHIDKFVKYIFYEKQQVVWIVVMQVSAASPGGRPPGYPGDLSKPSWQKDTNARGFGTKLCYKYPYLRGEIWFPKKVFQSMILYINCQY
jgi:hypothetical protein